MGILDRLRGKKEPKGPQISRSEFLKVKPLRNPKLEWEKTEEGKTTIMLPLKQPKEKTEEEKREQETEKKRRRISLFSSLSKPRQKKYQLDEIGSIVWELCDGKKTMEDIINHLSDKYKLLPNEAEVALNNYFNQLAERKLMVFAMPEEASARLRAQKEGEEEKKQ